jgi:hypothetical protein
LGHMIKFQAAKHSRAGFSFFTGNLTKIIGFSNW